MHNLYRKIPLLLATGSCRVINLLLFVYFTSDLQRFFLYFTYFWENPFIIKTN